MHGEFDSADSIKMDDSLKYQTVGGRTVYGGGGIMPDIFIPRDTSGVTSYYSNVVNSGVLYLYALEYSDRHREKLGSFKTWEELYNYLQQQPLLSDFVNFAATKGIKRRPITRDQDLARGKICAERGTIKTISEWRLTQPSRPYEKIWPLERKNIRGLPCASYRIRSWTAWNRRNCSKRLLVSPFITL